MGSILLLQRGDPPLQEGIDVIKRKRAGLPGGRVDVGRGKWILEVASPLLM